MFKITMSILALLSLASCAVQENYNPVTASQTATYELNQNALKNVKVGMKRDEAHQILGESITIGYSYSKDAQGQSNPITLKNPYKSEDIKNAKGEVCRIEYYVTAVVVPDGIVSNDELMPLTFCGDVLTAKGWGK